MERTKKRRLGNNLNKFDDRIVITKSHNKLPQHRIPESIKDVIRSGLRPWPGMSEDSIMYMNIFNQILMNEKDIELEIENYLDVLKTMMYVEQTYNELELENYNMSNQRIGQKMMKGKEYFEIKVESLVEECPSLTLNNLIQVVDAHTEESYLVEIKHVLAESVLVVSQRDKDNILNLDTDYRPTKRYHIIFVLNTYPFQCCHYALELINKFGLIPRLFPNKKTKARKIPLHKGISLFNKDIKQNPEQFQAITNILNRSSNGLPYILYGPPGTGKTATLIEAICQVRAVSRSSEKILVCTPSNDTADSLTKKLLVYMKKKDLLRLYSFSKDPKAIDKDLVEVSNVGYKQEEILPITDVCELRKIVITTLCTSTRLSLLKSKVNCFSYIFIDEAGQATEPDCIIPLIFLSSIETAGQINGQVVLAGDPLQLGPVIISRVAKKVLEKSLLDRLLYFAPYQRNNKGEYDPKFITKLLINYRSHPDLIHVSNQLFYEKELLWVKKNDHYKDMEWKGLPNSRFPMVFKQVWGEEARNFQSPSSFNEAELREVKRCVFDLIDTKTLRQKEIGIITPFTAQKLRLKAMLKDEGLENIEVGTVQLFQGREKEAIIMTTVRSIIMTKPNGDRHIGFLSDKRRFNVALTRAKCLQIIIGNPQVLEVDGNWSFLLNYCYENGAVDGNLCIIRNVPIKISNKNKRKKNNQWPRSNSHRNLPVASNNMTNITKEERLEKKIDNFLPLRFDNLKIQDDEYRNSVLSTSQQCQSITENQNYAEVLAALKRTQEISNNNNNTEDTDEEKSDDNDDHDNENNYNSDDKDTSSDASSLYSESTSYSSSSESSKSEESESSLTSSDNDTENEDDKSKEIKIMPRRRHKLHIDK